MLSTSLDKRKFASFELHSVIGRLKSIEHLSIIDFISDLKVTYI